MKYIRTKDGRIVDTSKKEYFVKDNDLILHEQYETVGGLPCEKGSMTQLSVAVITKHNEYSFVGTIEKQADTIEELCDCFVLETEGKITTYDKAYFTCFSEDWYHDYLKAFDSGAMLGHEMSVNGYGAIHVKDKGLKYVAKMNDKGELELL